MKGLFLFSQLNDVLFMSVDADISAFINEQARRVSLIGEEEVSSPVNVDVVIQLFSPLIASQRFMMSEVNNPYSSVRCQNDMIYVFSQIGDHTAIAIGSVAEEREEYFQRKLLVFKHILMLFHGPVIKQLHMVTPPSDEKWNLIGQLLDHWEYLYHHEQSFLMEALEWISVSEGLKSQCVKLLESIVTFMRSSGDKHVVHALLFVQTKLLALFSSRSAFELHSGDILLMILLSSHLFPWHPEDVRRGADKVSKPTTETEQKTSAQEESHEGRKSASSLNHVSGLSKQKSTRKSRHGSSLTCDSSEQTSSSSSSSLLNVDEMQYQEWTFLDDFQSEVYWDVNSLRLHSIQLSSPSSAGPSRGITNDSRHRRRDGDGQHRHQGSTGQSQGSARHGEDDKDAAREQPGTAKHHYRHYPVFFKTKQCCHHPVKLHIVTIFPGVTLVLVSESPKGGDAQTLVDAINTVNVAIASQCKLTSSVVSTMDKFLKKLDVVQKQNKNVTYLRQLQQAVQSKWTAIKELNMKMAKEKNRTNDEHRLENSLNGMMAHLENMFSSLFLSQNAAQDDDEPLHAVIQAIRRRSHDVLLAHKDDLISKTLHGVTMSLYTDSFPGLVHFIYVDRSTDYMKAPSLKVLSSGDSTKKHIHHKIWDVVQWFQTKLSMGYTSIMSRDHQLHFSYFLWFEDVMGNAQVAEQQFRTENSGLLPGTLSSNFYRNLVRDCLPSAASKKSLHCLELFCVHVGLVPTQYVLSHCRKLAAMLWEASDGSESLSIL